VHDVWRQKLRQLKRGELLGAIESLVQDLDHHVDRKDALIGLLQTSLDAAESQQQRLLHAHVGTLDSLLTTLQGDLQGGCMYM
ncbi:hypothetical protein KIPB_014881, partial [Kipferlia bialata]